MRATRQCLGDKKENSQGGTKKFNFQGCPVAPAVEERERATESWLPTESTASTFQRCLRPHKSKTGLPESYLTQTPEDSVSRRRGAQSEKQRDAVDSPLHRPPNFFKVRARLQSGPGRRRRARHFGPLNSPAKRRVRCFSFAPATISAWNS